MSLSGETRAPSARSAPGDNGRFCSDLSPDLDKFYGSPKRGYAEVYLCGRRQVWAGLLGDPHRDRIASGEALLQRVVERVAEAVLAVLGHVSVRVRQGWVCRRRGEPPRLGRTPHRVVEEE